jgi:hypothetical protein
MFHEAGQRTEDGRKEYRSFLKITYTVLADLGLSRAANLPSAISEALLLIIIRVTGIGLRRVMFP